MSAAPTKRQRRKLRKTRAQAERVTVRMSKALLARIDAAAGPRGRNRWLLNLIRAGLDGALSKKDGTNLRELLWLNFKPER